ncbi:PilT protein domain protein [Thioalkalivibrio nitratireducens DSM 14787]|uniref:PilT protein domain protein n=1 Tax=Thioalkalivibrio nitratireducens (strain DSM 14787 / UNIQEM 213 / ALEN2) TaxID=1255043 RepID=L0DT79_THIND|nr:type II toxin-antitoxin system VapC family toxin [Thioalkalivibrio nitratireducens]AGA32213.1 PilT protein domain protein [Thioalkalivibrio nitratireducens DSM 14787]
MRIVLDTHALLWWFTNDARLSAKAHEVIGDLENTVVVSAASAWEIATKHRLGKLEIGSEVLRRFDELITADGFIHLAVNYRQAIHAGAYTVDHRDPFDRILAAQAELEQVPLVTADPAMREFPIRCIW